MTKPQIAHIAGAKLEIVLGDIVQQQVDAIVNAANTSLLGGGGVDGAIHRAAGFGLMNETRKLGGCETGNAKITAGYRLPAKHVIHAVGPVYKPGDERVPALLASAHRHSLSLAAQHHLQSIAFPAISTGAYRYPVAEAASIALQTTVAFLMSVDQRQSVRLVRFVLFTDDYFQAYAGALRDLALRQDAIKVEV
jgi:O-acetyl-ADP-ribose deacetylase